MLMILGVVAVVGVLTALFVVVWWKLQDPHLPEKDRRFKGRAGKGDGGPAG